MKQETPTTATTLLDSRGEPLKEKKNVGDISSKEFTMESKPAESKPAEQAKSLPREVQDKWQESTRDVSKRATTIVGQVGEGAKEVSRTAGAASGHAAEGAKEILSDAREGAKNVAGVAQDAVGHAVGTGKEIIEDLKGGGKVLANTAMEVASEAKEVVQEASSEVAGIVKDTTSRAAHSVASAIHQVTPTIRRANRATGAFVASNAVPISLMGFGAGWMLMSARRRGSASPNQVHTPAKAITAQTPGAELKGPRVESRASTQTGETGLKDEAVKLVEGAAERAHEAASNVREEIQHVSAEARERAAKIKERAVHQLETARDVVSERATKLKKGAGERLERAKQTTTHLAETNPFMLVALSLGAGMGSAMLFPSSKPEKRLMGATRDRLVDEASETAARVRGVARETARNLRQNFHP